MNNPFQCGQTIAWLNGELHEGRLITWRGPTSKGFYELNVRADAGPLVTIRSPGPHARAAENKEVSRYV